VSELTDGTALIVVPADARYAGLVRVAVSSAVRSAGGSTEDGADLAAAVGEALAMSALPGSDERCSVSLSVLDDVASVTVTCEGCTGPTGDPDEREFGELILTSLVDEYDVSLQDGTMTVHLRASIGGR
jgi:anti-sigma regulatory factor (Ser/Thr protein kinase)